MGNFAASLSEWAALLTYSEARHGEIGTTNTRIYQDGGRNYLERSRLCAVLCCTWKSVVGVVEVRRFELALAYIFKTNKPAEMIQNGRGHSQVR